MVFFFFKQKTAYDMRISDWSSDVCSSDLAARDGANIMPPSIACAHAGVTTGEWGAALRRVFGEYRAPTGVGGAATQAAAGEEGEEDSLAPVRARVEALSRRLGRRLKMLVGKPGLDGQSNGAEQIDRKSTRLNSSH